MALYAALGVADAYLMIRYGRKNLDAGDEDDHGAGGRPDGEPSTGESEDDRAAALIY